MKFSIIFRIVLAATVFWGVSVATAQEMVTQGLISFWTLDRSDIVGDTVKDVWGSNHGKIDGGPEIVAGRVEEALSFDGEDDLVEIEHSESLNIADAITLEFWFLLKGNSVNNEYPRLVSKGQSTTTNGAYGIWVRDTRNPTDIGFRSVTLTPNDIRSQAVPNYDDNDWHHVAVTYDGQDGRLYVDGMVLADIPVSGEISQTDEPFHIGNGNYERPFNGLIDEVRIYNRALSEDEVLQNFNVESNSLCVDALAKLAALWGGIKGN